MGFVWLRVAPPFSFIFTSALFFVYVKDRSTLYKEFLRERSWLHKLDFQVDYFLRKVYTLCMCARDLRENAGHIPHPLFNFRISPLLIEEIMDKRIPFGIVRIHGSVYIILDCTACT